MISDQCSMNFEKELAAVWVKMPRSLRRFSDEDIKNKPIRMEAKKAN